MTTIEQLSQTLDDVYRELSQSPISKRIRAESEAEMRKFDAAMPQLQAAAEKLAKVNAEIEQSVAENFGNPLLASDPLIQKRRHIEDHVSGVRRVVYHHLENAVAVRGRLPYDHPVRELELARNRTTTAIRKIAAQIPIHDHKIKAMEEHCEIQRKHHGLSNDKMGNVIHNIRALKAIRKSDQELLWKESLRGQIQSFTLHASLCNLSGEPMSGLQLSEWAAEVIPPHDVVTIPSRRAGDLRVNRYIFQPLLVADVPAIEREIALSHQANQEPKLQLSRLADMITDKPVSRVRSAIGSIASGIRSIL